MKSTEQIPSKLGTAEKRRRIKKQKESKVLEPALQWSAVMFILFILLFLKRVKMMY